MIVKLREAGIPVISEMEFAGRYLGKARTICVTGSNGKTTTTSLIYKILRDAGYNVALGGNIGESFAYSVATGDYDWYVLELSSFQLDGMFRFRAHIGVLTNITPDHLDRYDYCFQNYVDAKMRITQNQNSRDFFIYSGDDEVIWQQLPKYDLRMKQLPFAAKNAVASGAGDAFLLDGKFTATVGRESVEMTRPKCGFPGCTTLIMLWRRRSQRSRPEYPRSASAAPSTTSRRWNTGSNPPERSAAWPTSTTRKPPTSIPRGTHWRA